MARSRGSDVGGDAWPVEDFEFLGVEERLHLAHDEARDLDLRGVAREDVRGVLRTYARGFKRARGKGTTRRLRALVVLFIFISSLEKRGHATAVVALAIRRRRIVEGLRASERPLKIPFGLRNG